MLVIAALPAATAALFCRNALRFSLLSEVSIDFLLDLNLPVGLNSAGHHSSLSWTRPGDSAPPDGQGLNGDGTPPHVFLQVQILNDSQLCKLFAINSLRSLQQLSCPLAERYDAIALNALKSLLRSVRPGHLNRLDFRLVSQTEVDAHVVRA